MPTQASHPRLVPTPLPHRGCRASDAHHAFAVGDKFSMFTQLLLTRDVPLIGLGSLVIVGMFWLYSGSLFVTLLGMLQVSLLTMPPTPPQPAHTPSLLPTPLHPTPLLPAPRLRR